MKKIFISSVLIISASVSAQLAVTSIENRQTELVINDSISIKKGNEIQIYLPAGKDFVFVKQKKSGLNAKLLGNLLNGTNNLTVNTKNIHTNILTGTINDRYITIEKFLNLLSKESFLS